MNALAVTAAQMREIDRAMVEDFTATVQLL